MPDYSLGKVYKIVNSMNDKIYIGSTCWPLSKRMAGHRDAARRGKQQALYCAMVELGIEKFEIVLIENYPCTDQSQLLSREYALMDVAKNDGIELYNHTTNGRHSKQTREKMRTVFQKRGCVFYHKGYNRWGFSWQENGKQRTKGFSANKYGTAARGLALYWQEEIYPIEREDDSELIREIRSRIEA